MGYGTIVAYLSADREASAGIAAAAALARVDNAHLTGLYVTPMMPVYTVSPYGGLDVSEKLIEEHRSYHAAEAEKIRTRFERSLAGEVFPREWASVDSAMIDPLEAILERGRAAELIVAVQDDPNDPDTQDLGIAERLMVEAGRPVLIVPPAWQGASIGSEVTVAWNGSREGARAVFDALPILRAAKMVHLVWVDPRVDPEESPSRAADVIAASLAHSGVSCEAVEASSQDHGVGDEILARARDYQSDLIVMGGYGHSRFRQWVFGGVTKHVLDAMPVPVLMSH